MAQRDDLLRAALLLALQCEPLLLPCRDLVMQMTQFPFRSLNLRL